MHYNCLGAIVWNAFFCKVPNWRMAKRGGTKGGIWKCPLQPEKKTCKTLTMQKLGYSVSCSTPPLHTLTQAVRLHVSLWQRFGVMLHAVAMSTCAFFTRKLTRCSTRSYDTCMLLSCAQGCADPAESHFGSVYHHFFPLSYGASTSQFVFPLAPCSIVVKMALKLLNGPGCTKPLWKIDESKSLRCSVFPTPCLLLHFGHFLEAFETHAYLSKIVSA